MIDGLFVSSHQLNLLAGLESQLNAQAEAEARAKRLVALIDKEGEVSDVAY